MTFDSNMKAIEQAQMPELYRITSSGYEWRYTSNRTAITFLGESYTPAAIKRSAFSNSKQIGESKVNITFALANPLLKYLSAYPLPSTSIQVFRAVGNDLSQYALLFDGKVRRTSFTNKTIIAESTVDDEMSAMVPNIVYQSYCNWQVFDCDCGLLSGSYEVVATVTLDSDGASLISSTFATYESGYFTQGWVKFDGDMRFITNHAGSRIDLQVPFGPNLVNGSGVYAYPGCDGHPDTCTNKFNNFNKWLGMFYIPSHNPVVWGFK